MTSTFPTVAEGFRFVDVAGDGGPPVDVDLVNVYLSFDPTTGDYDLLWVTDPASPFNGSFRLNANLFNPDTGTSAQDPAFFQDTFNDINLLVPQQTILLSGTNPRLTAWAVGDRVASTCPAPVGCPSGVSSFGSAVQQQSASGVGADVLGSQSPLIKLPEPSGLLALAMGSLGLSALRRRKRAPSQSPRP